MPFILLVLGLVLILGEFFASGGLFAIFGATAIISSVIWMGFETGSFLTTTAFALVAALSIYLTIRFGMRLISRRMQLDSDQEGYQACSLDSELVGLFGSATTDLRPSGKIEIKGAPYPAVSQKGYIEKGEKVEVIQIQMGHLIVR